MHLIDVARRRDGHLGRRRHDDPARRRLRVRAQAAARAAASSLASSATAPPRKACSTRASTSRALKKLPVLFVCENNLLRHPYAPAPAPGRSTTSVRARSTGSPPSTRGRRRRDPTRVRQAADDVRAGAARVLRVHGVSLEGARRPRRRLPPRLSQRGGGRALEGAGPGRAAGQRCWTRQCEGIEADIEGELLTPSSSRRPVRTRTRWTCTPTS